MSTRVGFIGLGQMGSHMAGNLLKKGCQLSIYNRTKEKAAPLLKAGADWSSSPKEIASKCDVLITMVSNDAVLQQILEGEDGVFKSEKKPQIHISMSTISPELCADLEKKHADRDLFFLAAPVSGRPERAEEGTLWIFLAGNESAKQKSASVLEKMSCKIFDLGENAAKASLFKLCNNFMILGLVEIFAEAAAMLEKNEISSKKGADIWGNSLFDSIVFHTYAPMICNKKFEQGGFALNLGLKDMRLLQSSADKSQVPMPLLALMHEKLLACMNQGKESCDWSAISLIARQAAGLED